ncbi:hypothetical protein K438DRAFT_1787446 [Mycena galopus ATCC 62051]|nr:hypothetical protein K438DRAFT_1787446 [Mycena galopus ATCC 62051]
MSRWRHDEVPHHSIGDINEFPEYQSMMSILKPLIRHFSKSDKSKAYLRDSGEGMREDGSNIPSALLHEVFGNRTSVKLPTFLKDMLSYKIVAPLVRSPWTLEATTANPSDASVLWLAITHTLDSIFEKKEKISESAQNLRGMFAPFSIHGISNFQPQ